MHSERPPKHHILHIFNAFIIFYYPSFLSIYPPPSLVVTPSIVRDDTLAFAAMRWVFVAWSAQIERKYTPQESSIPPTLLPRVASYRRQPQAIESTTPMGLPHHQPFITAPQRDDGTRHGIYHHTTTWSMTIPSHGIPPQMAGAHARKGAGEVTPKGLYARQGRVDERSEIYPV